MYLSTVSLGSVADLVGISGGVSKWSTGVLTCAGEEVGQDGGVPVGQGGSGRSQWEESPPTHAQLLCLLLVLVSVIAFS